MGACLHEIPVLSREETRSPIRIRYERVDLDLSPDADEYLINTVVAGATRQIERLLSVNRVTEKLFLDFDECADACISDQTRFQGFSDTDFVVFLTGGADEENMGSWSAPCARECDSCDGLTHPVAGRVWLNTSLLCYNSQEDNVSNLVHQTLHVLGFHSDLYPYWRQEDGSCYDSVTKIVQTRGKNAYAIQTPNVVAQARAQFGYDTLESLELEVSPECEGSGSNWEKRIMFNDIMTRGVDVEGTIISKITLAAMEDSGWYTPNYDEGANITWGRNAGSNFFNEKCVSNGEPNFSEFCTDFGNHSSCDISHTQVGRCNLKQYNFDHAPPTQYRYFWHPSWGGSDPYVDFCPYVQPYVGGDCRNEANDFLANEAWGEKMGANSVCIDGCFAPSTYASFQHGGCHEISCGDDSFVITIGSTNTITCDRTPETFPQVYTFPEDDGNFFGTVTCPDYDIVCGDWATCQNRCTGRGRCSGFGNCVCDAGWTGVDCSLRCHDSCATCAGPDSNQCTSCGSGWGIDTEAGTCSCAGYYLKPGTCLAEITGCPMGYDLNEVNRSCGLTDSPAMAYDFNSNTASGYLRSTIRDIENIISYVVFSSPLCSPWNILGRGAWFGGDAARQNVSIQNWRSLTEDFTVELWINPAAAGDLFTFTYNRQTNNGNFSIAECFALVLDLGLQQQATVPNALKVDTWSLASASVLHVDELVRSLIHINGDIHSMKEHNEDVEPTTGYHYQYIGGLSDFYKGFIAQFFYYEYCRNIVVETTCTGGCSVCPDSGVCFNSCGLNQYQTEDACASCDCNYGCNALGECNLEASACSIGNSADNCKVAYGSYCVLCDDGYELSAFPGAATCVECGLNCTNNDLFDEPDICSCPSGFYWEESGHCLHCHPSCETCFDGTVIGCTKCNGCDVLLPGTGFCTDLCPTGYQPTIAGTCQADADLSWQFTFNQVTTEYTDGVVSVSGGYTSGDHYIDDPYPIGNRGLWFDGAYRHLEACLSLSSSFTLEFFLKSYCADEETCSLFANYHTPYDNIGGSAYNFKIQGGYLTFSEDPSHVSLTTPFDPVNQDYMLQRMEWSHVALTVGFDGENSDVKFFLNGGLIAEHDDVILMVVDNSNLDHYIGGIRHHWKLVNAFEGFMWQINFSQTVKADFSDTFFGADHCSGDCTRCTACGCCLSDCEFFEQVVDGVCVSCAGTNECNTCGNLCQKCDEFSPDACNA